MAAKKKKRSTAKKKPQRRSQPATTYGRHGHVVESPPKPKAKAAKPIRYLPPGTPKKRKVRGEGDPQLLPRLLLREQQAQQQALQSAGAYSYRSPRPGDQPRNGQLGSDALGWIGDTTVPPFRHVCNLEIEPAHNGRRLGGTGWLIGSRTIITAGHCVFQRTQTFNDWADSITIHIARNGVPIVPPIVVNSGFKSVEGWTIHGREESDFGAIVLPTPVSVGNFGCKALGDSDLDQLLITVVGYPVQPPAGAYGTMWGEHDYITYLSDERIGFPVITLPGMSGGPVYYQQNGKAYAVGILNYQSGDNPDIGLATRVTPDVLTILKSWIPAGS